VYLAPVRYGRMNTTETFTSRVDRLAADEDVIVRTQRGIEWGTTAGAVFEQDRDEVKGLGEVLRCVTEADRRIHEHIERVKQPAEMTYCMEQIRRLDLPMKLAAVEHLFGGDKIIFYFLADGRVDFRQLVKELARNYRTRIDMRQIGVRDEARLLGDYEHCGRELCCRRFMRKLEPVAMRMAKLQKTTLDPSKISGHCGRLMCCLRFEDEIYAQLKRELPHKGTYVATDNVEGEVLDYDVLKQTCLLENSDGDRVTVRADEITERRGKRGRRRSGNGNANENGADNKEDRGGTP